MVALGDRRGGRKAEEATMELIVVKNTGRFGKKGEDLWKRSQNMKE